MKTFSMNSKEYQAFEVIRVRIPPGAQRKFVGANVRFTRENWPAGVEYVLESGAIAQNVVIFVSIEKTEDDGQTWQFVAGSTLHGGQKLNRDGTPVQFEFQTVSFFDANGPIAQPGDLRVTFKTFVPIKTAVSATLFEEGEVVSGSASLSK